MSVFPPSLNSLPEWAKQRIEWLEAKVNELRAALAAPAQAAPQGEAVGVVPNDEPFRDIWQHDETKGGGSDGDSPRDDVPQHSQGR